METHRPRHGDTGAMWGPQGYGGNHRAMCGPWGYVEYVETMGYAGNMGLCGDQGAL